MTSRPPMPPTTRPASAPAAVPTRTVVGTSRAVASKRRAALGSLRRDRRHQGRACPPSLRWRARPTSWAVSVGVVPTRMPRCLERVLLRLGGARGAGDDRARVAHRLAGRRGEAGDVGDDRLRHLRLDEVGGLLLLVAADLADHHDVLGLRVGLEPLEDVDERRADDRVAADADDRRVAEAHLRQLVPDLVGQRARARDEADVARR